MCKTCAHAKACKDKGDYVAAWAELQQPRITTFKAKLMCDNYAVDRWDGDVIVPSRDLPAPEPPREYGANPAGLIDRYYKAHC